MNRGEIAELMLARLAQAKDAAAAQFSRERYFVVDDLLPLEVADRIHRAFPPSSQMRLRSSLRERKLVLSQMDRCDRLLEEAIYAFQDERVVKAVEAITGLKAIEPDEKLYAGGISVMAKGHYLLPHIDNSHDMQRERRRVLNLLYYTTPGWQLANGGNFELWPNGPSTPLTIESRFNRLLVIATDVRSWHSVSKVLVDTPRTCVSNYYFSMVPPDDRKFYVTTFRGRPEQPLTNLLLRADGALRQLARKVVPGGLRRTWHYYKSR